MIDWTGDITTVQQSQDTLKQKPTRQKWLHKQMHLEHKFMSLNKQPNSHSSDNSDIISHVFFSFIFSTGRLLKTVFFNKEF